MLLITILVFIITLGILVLSHELGHLWAAKKLGIKVHEFGFGFPPKLWSKKIKGTLYSINLIPIGGYVKEDQEDFAKKSIKTRAMVLAAGVGMNLLTAIIFLTFLSFFFYPWYQAIFMGVINTVNLIAMIFYAFYQLITGGVSADILGPIGIASLTGDMVAQGFLQVVWFIALLSINLAIINILPFPALDGGRLLMLGIEKFKGSPVNQKIEHTIHATGFVILIVLMVLVTWRDIVRIL